MKLKCKPDFEESLARIEAWYEFRRLDRAPVRFHHHNVEYENKRTIQGPWRSTRQRWMDVEFQVNTFAQSLEGAQLLGETFPIYWPNLSAVVYNLFLGQAADFDDMTAWTHPCVLDLENLPPLKVQWDGDYFRTIEEMTRRAIEVADGRFLVGYTDMYAGIDCVAGLRGTEALCLDLVMDPEGVDRLIDRAFSEYAAVYRHFDATLKKHNQLSATWMNLPSRQTFNVLASDFAVNISREHFDRFCMPVLRREAELFVHNVYHVDGPGVARHIDSILTLPNLVGIQWAQGISKDLPILQWVPLIRKIQAAGKAVIVDLRVEELEPFMQQVGPDGILLWVSAGPADQRAVLDRVSRW